MSKQNILTILISVLPSYASLFSAPIYATLIVCLATLIGVFVTGVYDDAKSDADMRDKIRTAWVVHLAGVIVSIAWHNL